MSSESYHEPEGLLSDETKDMHRAIVSLVEELEAIDWYQQRAEACSDGELRAILIHNKNEEIEHAMMVLEWLRRRSPDIDANIAKYLRRAGSIVAVEEADKGAEAVDPIGGRPLGIGSLKSTSPRGG